MKLPPLFVRWDGARLLLDDDACRRWNVRAHFKRTGRGHTYLRAFLACRTFDLGNRLAYVFAMPSAWHEPITRRAIERSISDLTSYPQPVDRFAS